MRSVWQGLARVAALWSLVTVLATSLPALALQPPRILPPAAPRTATVQVDRLDLYSCATVNCQIKAVLPRGETLNVLEYYQDWIRVWVVGVRLGGWVRIADLRTQPPPAPTRATVTEPSLNLRFCAGRQCNVMAKLKKGEFVEVLDLHGGWAKVDVPSLQAVGWVSVEFLRFF